MKSQDLSKMGNAQVILCEGGGRPYINKRNASPVEVGFYQYAAPELKNVQTPQLINVDGDDLFIELVPNKVTLEELQQSSGTFEQLSHIHQSSYIPTFEVKQHAWSLQDTEFAFRALSLPSETQDALLTIQTLSSELFEHRGLVSGDTNDGNWGRRDNGELVLFDWERFGFGSPAIDLAPLVKGLGTRSDYRAVIDKYLIYNPSISAELLEKHLVIAKAWIVIEVTNLLISRRNHEAQKYINWFNGNVPAWCQKVVTSL
ncbi:phosphotransferase family protein [Vibrio mediterranei]|uniref:Choline kinase n=1 Tax=Vibrio mediterranei TaxID=689 RepID=A0A3G4VDS8_9VIBR|nr:phosphotransferase [Vibrio mediterranei]AYV22854.1 choline kinase [Vibrio mediterranei]